PMAVYGKVGGALNRHRIFCPYLRVQPLAGPTGADPPADVHERCGRDETAPQGIERRGETIRRPGMLVQSCLARDTPGKEVRMDNVRHILILQEMHHYPFAISPVFPVPEKN